jgi:hypothetical protein
MGKYLGRFKGHLITLHIPVILFLKRFSPGRASFHFSETRILAKILHDRQPWNLRFAVYCSIALL